MFRKKIKWIQLSSGCIRLSKKAIIDEFAVENPNNLYEETKVKSDQLIKRVWFKFTILRPSIVFGNEMKSTLLKDLSKTLKKDYFLYR